MNDIAIKQAIDKTLLQKRFCQASSTYDQHALVQQNMAKKLVSMAKQILPGRQECALELGCGTGLLTKEIQNYFKYDRYTANDLVCKVESNIKNIVAAKQDCNFNFIQGDAEQIRINQKQDVIWSGATIQWIQDLDMFFSKISQSLKTNGYFMLSSFDTDNFKEIKTLTGKGIDYLSMQDVILKASSFFKITDQQSWFEKLYFNNPIDVLKHMRFTGVNALTSARWNKSDLENFTNGYQSFKTTKGFPLTYNPFILILKKR